MENMTHEIRKKIAIHVKNHLDISDLIRDVNVKGEDLTNAIIKDFSRSRCDMSGTKFKNATIGEEGRVTNLCRNRFIGCDFERCKFIGKILLRRCDCRDSYFVEASMCNVEAQYSNFVGCNFCETALRLGSDYLYMAKVDKNLFRDLTKYLNISVVMKEPPVNKELEKKIEKGELNE